MLDDASHCVCDSLLRRLRDPKKGVYGSHASLHSRLAQQLSRANVHNCLMRVHTVVSRRFTQSSLRSPLTQ